MPNEREYSLFVMAARDMVTALVDRGTQSGIMKAYIRPREMKALGNSEREVEGMSWSP
jgi:hypothetical protein